MLTLCVRMEIYMKIAILGSTGSIGRQTADVAAFHGYEVEAVCAARSIDILEAQVRRFSPKYCGVFDEKAAAELRMRIADTNTCLFVGESGILEMIGLLTCDTVVNAIVGKAGLLPTLAVIEKGITLALANKESLVCAGEIVMAAAEKYGVELSMMVGFLDGINDSLVTPNPIEEMTEDTKVSLNFDNEKLYYNMVAARADWLYELPAWNDIIPADRRKELFLQQRKSNTVVKDKKIGRNDPCPCGSGRKYKQCCGK